MQTMMMQDDLDQRTADLTKKAWERLARVIDPELHIDIVSIGLIYKVVVKYVDDDGEPAEAADPGSLPIIWITMTLTTPGCPLAGVFGSMVREQFEDMPEIADPTMQVITELTFDPPWFPDMMSDEAKAELGM
jgi:metal-sulfur cluster biosynthetic enzyme